MYKRYNNRMTFTAFINSMSIAFSLPATLFTIFIIISAIVSANNSAYYSWVSSLPINKDTVIFLLILYGLGLLSIILSTFTSGTIVRVFSFSMIIGLLPNLFPILVAIPYIGFLLHMLFVLLGFFFSIVVCIALSFIPVGISILQSR